MSAKHARTDRTLLFLYGTLKRGHCRAPMLAEQRFVGQARTEPFYRLLHCGSYPGLVPTGSNAGYSVKGELWEVDSTCLARLDEEEGIAEGLYRRAAIALAGAAARGGGDEFGHSVGLEEAGTLGASSEMVEGYLYLGNPAGLRECGPCWTLDLERRALGGL